MNNVSRENGFDWESVSMEIQQLMGKLFTDRTLTPPFQNAFFCNLYRKFPNLRKVEHTRFIQMEVIKVCYMFCFDSKKKSLNIFDKEQSSGSINRVYTVMKKHFPSLEVKEETVRAQLAPCYQFYLSCR